jgi:hypothetical protein
MSSARPTDFALPDLPVMPVDAVTTVDPSDIVSDQLAGLGGMGGGGGSGSGGGGKGGSAVNFFGISDTATRVIVVVDVSDTMFDRVPGKFDVVKQQAIKLIKGLGINTLFNVVIYEGGSVSMFPAPQPATDGNKEKAVAWVQSVDGGFDKKNMHMNGAYKRMGTPLYEGGGTRPDTALKQALSMSPSTIFMISDGEMSRKMKKDKDDDREGGKGKRDNQPIDQRELMDIVDAEQAKLATPARIHAIHFVTGKARKNEEDTLRALARKNDGRFKQVSAERADAEDN